MSVIAALLAAAAAWLWLAPAPEPRARALLPFASLPPTPLHSRPRLSTVVGTRLAAAVAALGAVVMVGGVVGIVMGAACLLVVPRLLGRLEPRADRDRRAAIAAQAPLVADLLGATLAAASPMGAALAAVSDAVGTPAQDSLRPVVAALDLGADTASAWAPLLPDPSLGAVAAAAVRSADTGAPLSAVLARIADDLRREHQAAVEVAARTAGVRAVLPLAACFLPAFLLLGVVPVVAALAGGLMA